MRLDVRCKIFLFIIISITSFLAKDIHYGSAVFLIVCLFIFSLGQMKIAAKYIIAYLFVIAVIELSAFLPALLRSLILMTTLCIRMFMPLILYAKAFAATTTVSELITGLYAMHLPRALVITFAVAMRFFPTVIEEIRNIKDAMRLRGLGFSFLSFLRHPAFLFDGFFTPLIMRSSTISEELSAASITRGLENPNPRTAFNKLRLTFADVAITSIFAVALCIVVGIRNCL
ncbi:energy-coupling factor transport system permease protein [Ruminiclostridium sufflavum DSM 19573]|uniref:Energy-coupling factor transport system permease protein n=1 Tax=Ruminiclostridium sufflavum DSM 19573 TaxID=1121337 RepID=A0A318XTD0_9FIRM|nr:energy-coupling factor transporter transmembrane component T [Ruminiclostridium sufflavum]PYG89739.1 energy-coupling factor transport system permease protein [Ruminiclostridium sufflavum DSM 19573]